MQVSIETTSGLERRLTVGVPAERVESEVNSRLQKAAKNIRLDGFRPGKVPPRVLERSVRSPLPRRRSRCPFAERAGTLSCTGPVGVGTSTSSEQPRRRRSSSCAETRTTTAPRTSWSAAGFTPT